VTGAVGAVIALPALRMSGIYLALGTAAFAMVLDRWVFTLPDVSVFGLFDVRLFNQGSVEVAPPELFGFTFESAGSQMILSAVVFAVLSLGVVAVRRGRAGRRLLAIKDSEAACATLGGDILGSKMLVFAASAAIAGIGGALYSAQLQSISATDFNFVGGLPVFVLAVVGGIATVGGAFFAGAMLNGLLPAAAVLAPALVKLSALLPGAAGVGLGKNPNGLVSDMRQGTRSLTERPAVWGPLLGALAGAYALRLAGVIDNWLMVVAMFVVGVAALFIARSLAGRATAAGSRDEPEDVPLEWRGLRRPWQPSDAAEIDEVLGVGVR
jgi:branched-chain amino acid transport system permease protein